MFEIEFYRTEEGDCPISSFLFSGRKIVITNGFVKKTRKTPRCEIFKALEYKKDWEERNYGK